MARSLLAAAAAGLALIQGTPDADRLSTANGRTDRVVCGKGLDLVVADSFDRVARDCETVSLRLSVDTTTGPAQHRTEVEPSAAAFGSTVVSTFQVGRFENGGAEAIGFAASRDAGRTWRSGLLPGLTVGGGPWARVSDPVVAYDAAHGVWLGATLALAQARNAVVVNRSADAVSWSPPVTVADAPSPLAYDKEWVACDNWPSSPYRGSCYLQWTDVINGGIASQVSRDGGLTWSAPVTATNTGFGAQPVVLPDGSLATVALSDAQNAVLVARSTDGGASFSPLLQISELHFAQAHGLRAPPLPSVAVDGAGKIVAAWPDCRFRPQCTTDDIVVMTSTDGATWSAPARAATAESGTSALVPGLGAGPADRFALTYYAAGAALTGVRTTESLDGGATWSAHRRLEAVPMHNSWLAQTEGGLFAGDYIATPFVAGHPVPVFSLAVASRRQSIFAAVR
jgi:hypothetical protein